MEPMYMGGSHVLFSETIGGGWLPQVVALRILFFPAASRHREYWLFFWPSPSALSQGYWLQQCSWGGRQIYWRWTLRKTRNNLVILKIALPRNLLFKSFFFWSFKMSIWCFPEGESHKPKKAKERVKKPKCWTRFLQIKWGICSTRGCLEEPDCQFIIEENSHWFLHSFSSKKDFFAWNQNISIIPPFLPKRVPKR